MPRNMHTLDEIIANLRQVDVLVSQGASVVDAVRQIDVWHQNSDPRCPV
jgi:hypothetical protein